MIYLYIIFLFQ